jgi:hypothetical protein
LQIEAKGRTQFIFKHGSKRRRTKVEIDEAKEEEQLRQEGRDRQQLQIAELQGRIRQMEGAGQNNGTAARILQNWIEEGSVLQNENGDCFIQPNNQ